MRLYLIRHGETEYNHLGIMQGYGEVPLNDAGIDQAMRLGRRMADFPVDRIVSSDLRRAAMTACIVAAHTGKPLTWDEGFRERDPGELTNVPHEKAMRFFTDPDFEPPGGESVPVFTERVEDAFSRLLAEEDGSDRHIAVVSHGMVCGAFMRVFFGKTRDELADVHWPNTSLSIADYNGSWSMVMQGDASHLDNPASRGTPAQHATGA